MFRNYLLTAARHILRNKAFSIINLLGLSLGIAVTLVVSLYVIQESSYNKHHKDNDQIFRLNVKGKSFRGEEKTLSVLPVPAGPAILENFSEVESILRSRGISQQSLSHDKSVIEDLKGMSFDQSLFDIFDFRLTDGSENTALKEPNSVVLTSGLAKRLFSDRNVIGEILKAKDGNLLKVTGVLSEGNKTHLDFDYIIPFNDFLKTQPDFVLGWSSSSIGTYLKIRPEVDLKLFQESISAMLNGKRSASSIDALGYNTYYLQPIADVYLDSENISLSPGERKGDLSKVRLFSIIAIAVLLMACINFVNLTTSSSIKRAKEVGLRKVIGANRKQLIFQFLFESTLTAFIAGVLAILFADLMVISFGEIVDQELLMTLYANKLIVVLVSVVLITGVVAGLYPAWYLSSFSPVRTLSKTSKRSGIFRNGLFVFQFSIAIIFIVATLVVNRQLRFIKQKDMGFDVENLMYVNLRGSMKTQQDIIIDDLSKSPWIKSATWSQNLPMISRLPNMSVVWGEDEEGRADYFSADYNFVETAGMRIVDGRNFEPDEAQNHILVNETAARKMGMKNLIGNTIKFQKGSEVIGVVEDFHYESLHTEIKPTIFIVPSDKERAGKYSSYVLLRVDESNRVKAREALEAVLGKYNDQSNIEYGFLSGSAYRFYTEEEKIVRAFTYSASFSILIASMGLLGLMISAISARTQELSIRKVLGATAWSIGSLLSWQFVVLISISILISTPVIVYGMNSWLADFSYRIVISPMEFVMGGVLVMMVSFSVVGVQIYNAANANPIDSLKHE